MELAASPPIPINQTSVSCHLAFGICAVIMKVVVFMFAVSAFAGKIFGPVPSLRNGIGGKIVGGQEADEGEYPWQVSWRRSAGQDGSHS